MNNREIEIDLKSLLIYLFEHWRSIIAVMIICGILGGAFGVYRANKANSANTAIQEKTETVDENTEKKIKSREDIEPADSLTPNQIANVERAIDNMDHYLSTRSFYDSSIYMKLDPDSIAKGTLIVDITPHEIEKISSLRYLYTNYILSPEFVDRVRKNTGCDINEKRIINVDKNEENLNVSKLQDDPCSIVISIIYTDEKNCKAILDEAVEYLQEKCAEISEKYGMHKLDVIDTNITSIADFEVGETQVSMQNTVKNYYYTALDLRNGFNDEQKIYYSELLKTLEGYSEEEPEVEEEAVVIPMVSRKKQGIKYGIVGLFAGAFMMACLWALIYIFRNRADLYDDISGYYGLSELGRIPRKKKEKEFIFDKWIRKWKNYPLKSEYDEAVKLCATQIQMIASKEQVDDIIIMSCAKEFEPTGEIEKLANEVGALSIKASTIENVLYDTEKMNRLANAKGVVLAGKSDLTRRNDLFKSVDIMKRQGIKMLGGVIVG